MSTDPEADTLFHYGPSDRFLAAYKLSPVYLQTENDNWTIGQH